jgi:hypothetical protein
MPLDPNAAGVQQPVIRALDLISCASHLANAAFVRYWLHWNYPCRDPWVMALEVRDWRERGCDSGMVLQPVQVAELERRGFEWDDVDQRYYANRDTVADGIDLCPPG